MALAEFVSYLVDRGMIDIKDMPPESDKWFHMLELVQKYTFYARYYGHELGYRPDYNAYGFHSTDLTSDFEKIDFENLPQAAVPEGLRDAEFVALLKGREYEWILVASQALQILIDTPHQELHARPCEDPESKITKEYIATVLDEIKKLGLVDMVKEQGGIEVMTTLIEYRRAHGY